MANDEEVNEETQNEEAPQEGVADTEATNTADDATGAIDGDIEEGLSQVAAAAEGVSSATKSEQMHEDADEDGDEDHQSGARTVDFIKEVPLSVTVEVGRARMTIQDLLQLGQGSVVELEKLAGDPLDIFINGQRVARGEAVIVNEKFGIRLTDIISSADRLESLK